MIFHSMKQIRPLNAGKAKKSLVTFCLESATGVEAILFKKVAFSIYANFEYEWVYCFTSAFLAFTQVNPDVRNDHEIYLRNGHHGKLPCYKDNQKNHIRKYFTAIFSQKLTFCLF